MTDSVQRETPMSKPEDKPAHTPTSLGRRSFLFASTGTGVAALAAVAAVKTPEAPPAEALAEPDGQGEGYRLTGHIQRYYRSTRL